MERKYLLNGIVPRRRARMRSEDSRIPTGSSYCAEATHLSRAPSIHRINHAYPAFSLLLRGVEAQIIERRRVVVPVDDVIAGHLEEELKELAQRGHVVQRVIERQERIEEEFGQVVVLWREIKNQCKPEGGWQWTSSSPCPLQPVSPRDIGRRTNRKTILPKAMWQSCSLT